MIIRYEGHSFFTLYLENGAVVATDPYGDFYQYPKRGIRADICTVSHHHGDHDGLSCLAGDPVVVDEPGARKLDHGVRVIGVATKHDDKNGALRGNNTFFVIEAEGLRVGHAGDLGHILTPEQIREIGALDVLLLPVGGYYTIDAATALEVARALKPTVTIPMHYRTRFDPDMPIAPVQDFLALAKVSPEPMPLMRVAKADVCERPSICVLDVEGA